MYNIKYIQQATNQVKKIFFFGRRYTNQISVTGCNTGMENLFMKINSMLRTGTKINL